MSGTRGTSTKRKGFAGRTETVGFSNPTLLDGFQNVGNKAKQGPVYCNLSDASYDFEDFKTTLRSQKREDFAGRTEAVCFKNPALLDGVQNVGNKAKQGPVYCNLGDAYYDLGDFKQALQNHELYLESTIELGDRVGKGRAYGCLGKDHHGLDDYGQAINYHEQQCKIAVETRDRAEESRACEYLGNTCYSMEDFKLAIKWYKRALCIVEEIGDMALIGKLNRDLGNSYCRDGSFDDAIEHHRRDLRIAEQLKDKEGEGIAFGNLGNIYLSLGFLEHAIECQKFSLNIAKEVRNSAEEGKASYDVGCSFESMGNLDEALNWFQTSLNTFEDIRSRGQSNDEWNIKVQNEYKLVVVALCRILLKQNKIKKALTVADKGRAQALIHQMRSRYEINRSGSAEGDCTVLSNNSPTTVFLAIDKNDVNIWVLLKENGLYFRKSEIGERCLKEDETLSFTSLTQAAYPLPQDEIRERAASALVTEHVIMRQRADLIKKASRILYDVVISPVADLLEGDELIIVPDGPLCVAPFAAFLNSSSRYLCESFRIRVIPSLSCLKQIVHSSEYHSRKGVLLVGNPCLEEIVTSEPWNWNLPKAEEEVNIIGEILHSEPLIGMAATKEEVLRRLKSVSLVHIAAQGSEENGEILLTPNPTRQSKRPDMEDYMLSTTDVMGIQLRARLVVLSSCHSAQGRIKAEGAVGIARAFLAAGARCVLVSLWEIDDEATLEFMKSLYENLLIGKTASVALNQAMKYLKESQKFGDVKHWAAFQLIGDDVTLEFEEEE